MNFNLPYDRGKYIEFFRNQFLPEDFDASSESISLSFSPQYTQQVTKIGQASSLDLNVYEVQHASENDPRVSLSKESFRLLAEYGQKKALVLFISQTSPNYRLSLVTIDLKWEKGKRPTKEYSNPKRLSFFLGPDAKVHTPQEYLIKPGRVRDLDDIKNRFSIEVVTKAFYKEYAQVFGEIEKVIAKTNKLSPEDLRLYTQSLMNRLMYLRFLEKKRWIKFGGSPDYLGNLYAAGGLDNQSFFKVRLCPLFFEALAVEGKQESKAVGHTVFLNGGLFERDDLDKKVEDIPDDAFKNLLGPDGLFYKFNFTVEESTPIDVEVEVAVDPEMLGKVFEELVTGRHETGSYYTPRPIVSFMCREAVKGYLTEKTSASKEAIELLINEHEIADNLTTKDAEEILFYLETLKAVDPACGSGAYLLGLLHELIEIRKILQNQQLKSDPDFIYKLKLRLISHCLYGVDIDPFATNIAKLRLWLSLAVESDTPQPLPNLEFKIETGDAILGPCDVFADSSDALVMSALRQRAQQLVLKKDQYLLAHGEEKEKLYEEIVTKENEIAKETGSVVGKGIIAWHVHFAEVFTRGRKTESTFDSQFGFMADAHKQKAFKITSFEPGGFDIVLANPPYVRQELIKEIKPKLKGVYPKTYIGTADLYTYFYTRAVELLTTGGMLVFISSNKWFRANYGKKIRKYIADACYIHSITDFGELPVFETASTFPMIFVAQKSVEKRRTLFTQVTSLDYPYPYVQRIINTFGDTLPEGAISGESWNLINQISLDIVKKMMKNTVLLEDYLGDKIYVGIKTGLNKVFLIDSNLKNELISGDPSSEELIKPVVKGDDVRKWHLRDKNRWLILTKIGVEIENYLTVFEYLKKWQKELKRRSDQGNHWWELRPCNYYDIFEKSVILFPDIAKEPRFALSRAGIYSEMTAFALQPKSSTAPPIPAVGFISWLEGRWMTFSLISNMSDPEIVGGFMRKAANGLNIRWQRNASVI